MRLINNFLLVYVKLEIELPCANWVRDIALFISDSQTDLNEFGFLNIGPDQEILGFFFGAGTLDVISVDVDARKLGVLIQEGVTMAITLNFSVIFISLVISSSKL